MKLSNKILLGFFGGGMIYMLLAFTEIRLKGDDSNACYYKHLRMPRLTSIMDELIQSRSTWISLMLH